MEKELKSCTGVLLRTDHTGHGQFSQSADFCKKGWDAHAEFQFFFHNAIMYYIFSTTCPKNGDLFCPVIFLDF